MKLFFKVTTFIFLLIACDNVSKKTSLSDRQPLVASKQSIDTSLKQVRIGNQIWATQNLNVDTFNNGQKIPYANNGDTWQDLGIHEQPAWCYYNFDSTNSKIYGKLYNWYAVNDPRGLSPEGWKVPSDEDWTTLINYLNEGKIPAIAGTVLKNNSGWKKWDSTRLDNGNGTNSTGFSALPGGRIGDKHCAFQGTNGWWWSSTEVDIISAISFEMFSGWVGVERDASLSFKGYGLSVRCILK